MISLLFYSVFFLFSSTKIGHGRPSVKNRYAISDKNILRSYVVRYFYPNYRDGGFVDLYVRLVVEDGVSGL